MSCGRQSKMVTSSVSRVTFIPSAGSDFSQNVCRTPVSLLSCRRFQLAQRRLFASGPKGACVFSIEIVEYVQELEVRKFVAFLDGTGGGGKKGGGAKDWWSRLQKVSPVLEFFFFFFNVKMREFEMIPRCFTLWPCRATSPGTRRTSATW